MCQRCPNTATASLFAIVVLMCLTGDATAAGTVTPADVNRDRIAQTAARIDELVAAQWKEKELTPAELASDAEFLRRVTLDLNGRLPHVSAVRAFLASTEPNKRRDLIEKLLNNPRYAVHFAQVFRSTWMPEVASDPQARYQTSTFDAWVLLKLARNDTYDDIVRELLTTPMTQAPRNYLSSPDFNNASPAEYYVIKKASPENLAAAASRSFLGVQLDCAQCHDHPFADWKQQDFWSLAAFFSRVNGNSNEGGSALAEKLEAPEQNFSIRIPDSGQVVPAKFLAGQTAVTPTSGSPRVVLADWITARDNPYFARATVNRLWAVLFGIGLVDPVDNLDPNNPASHPQLLDYLAQQFTDSEFNLKFILAAMVNSRVYQLGGAAANAGSASPRDFAWRAPKMMTAEQLYFSLSQIRGNLGRDGAAADTLDINAPGGVDLEEFFASPAQNSIEIEASVLQELSLLNGALVGEATSPVHSEFVLAVDSFPLMSPEEKVETLFLATLSRQPTAEELAPLVEHYESGGTEGVPVIALCDVLWALLNSTEFVMNH